mgnify:CR=1 FL=1
MLANPDVEDLTHRTLERIVRESPGAVVHEVGGTDDHIHLAVTLPPTYKISDWIGQLKGKCSHDVNKARVVSFKALQWQSGYGVVSFGTKDLDWVKRYVRNQREAHARRETVNRLEMVEPMDEAEVD